MHFNRTLSNLSFSGFLCDLLRLERRPRPWGLQLRIRPLPRALIPLNFCLRFPKPVLAHNLHCILRKRILAELDLVARARAVEPVRAQEQMQRRDELARDHEA